MQLYPYYDQVVDVFHRMNYYGQVKWVLVHRMDVEKSKEKMRNQKKFAFVPIKICAIE